MRQLNHINEKNYSYKEIICFLKQDSKNNLFGYLVTLKHITTKTESWLFNIYLPCFKECFENTV